MIMALMPPNSPLAMILSVPLFHATGLYTIFLAGLLMGRKMVIMKKWNTGLALALMEREKVTSFTGVPTMVLDLLSHPDREKRDLSSLKQMGSGGMAPPAGVAKSILSQFKSIPAQGYGLTEVNCICAIISAQDYLDHPTSTGKALPGITIQIWSEAQDLELPPGKTGRIVVRGPTIMLEYWKDIEATRKAITKDGWFITGDYGWMDQDGFLYVTGRSQDLIIRGGENISARTVEEAIYESCGSILECAVFGYPHPTLGEEVGVAITIKPGHTAPSLPEMREKLAPILAAYMIPTGLAIFDHEPLPRTATEKTLKRDIKQLLKEGKLNWTTLNKALL
jgi:long-chain acyl-CoA synthetase